MFRREDGEPFLQEAAIEIRIVGDDEHYPVEQTVDGGIVNAVTCDHLIGNAGHVRNLRWDRNGGIFEPLPGAENFVDPPVLTVIFEQADAEFDNHVAIEVGAGGFHIRDGGDELWTAIGQVEFGLWLQPTDDTIIAALDERSGHLFQRVIHVGGIANSTFVFNPLHRVGTHTASSRFELPMAWARQNVLNARHADSADDPNPTNTAPLQATTAP